MMLPQNIGISDTDMCKIYGNILENAVDAVKDLLPENKPYVKMLTKVKNRKLLIEISNPYSNEIQRREKVFYSTKHEGFGLSLIHILLHLKVLLWEHVPVTSTRLSWNSSLRKKTLISQV